MTFADLAIVAPVAAVSAGLGSLALRRLAPAARAEAGALRRALRATGLDGIWDKLVEHDQKFAEQDDEMNLRARDVGNLRKWAEKLAKKLGVEPPGVEP